MKKRFGIALALSLGLLSASTAMANDAVAGALLGGGVGALVGHSVGGRDGAIIGGSIGAITGVVIADDGHGHRRNSRVYLAPPPPVYYAPPPSVYYAPQPVVYAPPPPPRVFVQRYYDRHDYHDRRGRHDRHDDDRRHWR